MKFKCKKCGAKYEYLDIYYNGNGDGKRFISCDECNAITIINFADYYHGWNPNRDELIIIDVVDSVFDEIELKPNQKKAIKWVDDEEDGFPAGFYSFIEDEDGNLVECGDYTPLYSEDTLKRNADFYRCMKEREVKVYWDGYESEVMERVKKNKENEKKIEQKTESENNTSGKILLHEFSQDTVNETLNTMKAMAMAFRNKK